MHVYVFSKQFLLFSPVIDGFCAFQQCHIASCLFTNVLELIGTWRENQEPAGSRIMLSIEPSKNPTASSPIIATSDVKPSEIL